MSASDSTQLPSWARRIAVFDLETTGISPVDDRIVTAHLSVLDERGEIVREEDWLADPGVEIPAGATRVHGVTTERAQAEGRPVAEVTADLVRALREVFSAGIPVVAYNASYDFSLLKAEADRHGVPWPGEPKPVLDPYVLDKQFDRFRRGKRTLGVTCEVYGVALEAAHTASDDAIAAGRLLQAIAAKHAAELPDDAIALHEATKRWAREQSESFQEYRRRTDPSFSVTFGWPVSEAVGG